MNELDKELTELRADIIYALENEVLNVRQIAAMAWTAGVTGSQAFGAVLNTLMDKDDEGLTPNDLYAYTMLLDSTEESLALAPAFSLPLMRRVPIGYVFFDDEGVPRYSALAIISDTDDGFAIPYTTNGIEEIMREQGGDIEKE